MRQVELIEPRVICTLGNFSTKLLRGDPTGISRLHGQAEIIVIGSRAVRLYPLFHPAAALYTRSLLRDAARGLRAAAGAAGAGPARAARAGRRRRLARAGARARARRARAADRRRRARAPRRAPAGEDDRQLGLF